MTNYYIGVSNGLLRDGHRKRMGEAVWEFMWLIDRVTRIDERQRGYVLGGRPVKLAEIARELEVHEVTVSRNLAKLQGAEYIDIVHAPHGLIIVVRKAKKRFNRSVGRFNRNAERFSGNVKRNIKTVSETDTKTGNASRKKNPDEEYEEMQRESKRIFNAVR